MGTRRLNRPELFELLGYHPHAGQVAVHKSRARRRVLSCGARWGKSHCAAYECIAALMSPCERSLGWLVAPTYDLGQRVFGIVLQVVKQRLAHRIREHIKREHRLIITNLAGGESEVRVKSADNEASLLGEALDWLVVDEAARLDERVWQHHLAQRLIDRKGWSLLASTPRGQNWFHTEFKRGQKKRDPDCASWSFASWTNPHLDNDAIEAERKRLGPDVFAQEFGGEFIGVPIEPCDLCGGPSRDVPGCAVMDGIADPPCCLACRQPVDEDGHTLVNLTPSGQPYFRLLQLCPGFDADPGALKQYDGNGNVTWPVFDPGPGRLRKDFFRDPRPEAEVALEPRAR